MSKAHDPHWRYIAVRLQGTQVSRRALQNTLVGKARKVGTADADLPQLTRFSWPHAVVRVHHHQVAAARAWLADVSFAIEAGAKVDITVEPLSTGGTIKAVTERLGILVERGAKTTG